MTPILAISSLGNALLTAGAMGVACAILSIIVVLRRWAFIGEGIAHAGFGGAGTAWLLSAMLPSVAFLSAQEGVYAVAVVFSICVGVGIAWITRREEVRTDTAIGIFLVASLAWGFIAYGIYTQLRQGASPPGWDDYLLGRMSLLPFSYAIGAVLVCAAVVVVMLLLGKEILAYCLDPALAEVSGVPVGLVHYLLIIMVAVTIVIAMRLMGSLLATALLVLPGATALLLSRHIGTVLAISTAVGFSSALAGPLVNARWPFIPEGPAIVVALILEFCLAYAWRRARR